MKSIYKKGFTVIELLIIAPIVVLFIGAFISVIVGMTGEVLTNKSANLLVYDIQDTLSRIDNDIKSSNSFLATNSVSITSPQGYNDATSAFTNVGPNGNMLILNSTATSTNPLSTSSGYIYLKNKPNDCTSGSVDQNKSMPINIVYFVKNNSLWRRTIMPNDYDTAGCGEKPWEQPTCTPGYTAPFCETQDTKLLDNVDPGDFVVNYYTSESSQIADPISIDTASFDSVRNASLVKMNTAVISLNIDKTTAGRAINRSESIRSTRIDTNVAAAETQPATTKPLPPTTINANIDPASPDSVIFEWGKSDGATSYDISKDIGSGWVTASTGSNNTTITIKNYQGGSACVRIYARNSAGQSTTNTSKCLDIPTWQPLVLQNGWRTYGGTYGSARYTKTSAGVVMLDGLIKTSTAPATYDVISSLPASYRPSAKLMLSTETNANTYSRIDVSTDGTISFIYGSGGWFSLSGISFISSSAEYIPQTLTTFMNGWYDWGTSWSPTSYVVDSLGRVHVQGLAGAGSFTNGAVIVRLPNSLIPSQYQHIWSRTAGSTGWGYVGLEYRNGGADIVAKAQGSAYLSLSIMYIPASYTDSTWITPTLLSGWKWYGSIYSTPQYTKSSDGIVMLKGLINAGTATAGTKIFTLPVGYRPSSRQLMGSVSVDLSYRIDVETDGSVYLQGGNINTGWLSLDTVRFLAEQ